MRRNYGLDIFRIMCCMGVLFYHVMDDVLWSRVAYALWYGASFCVPGFFVLSGYLMASKDNCRIEYYENKIRLTMCKWFGWIIFWAIIHFMVTSEVRDVWNDLLWGAAQSGTLPVAWFLFTYIVLIILAYPLLFILKKNTKFFMVFTACWMVLLAIGDGNEILNSKPQPLWIHMYLGYFAIGMMLSRLKIHNRNKKYYFWGAIIGFFVCSIVYISKWKIGLPHQHYGTWYYSIWLISIFIIILHVNICNEKIRKIIMKIADNTFTIYLGHLPILLYLTSKYPLKGVKDALIMIIALFVILNIVAEGFRKMPILRKIV